PCCCQYQTPPRTATPSAPISRANSSWRSVVVELAAALLLTESVDERDVDEPVAGKSAGSAGANERTLAGVTNSAVAAAAALGPTCPRSTEARSTASTRRRRSCSASPACCATQSPTTWGAASTTLRSSSIAKSLAVCQRCSGERSRAFMTVLLSARGTLLSTSI